MSGRVIAGTSQEFIGVISGVQPYHEWQCIPDCKGGLEFRKHGLRLVFEEDKLRPTRTQDDFRNWMEVCWEAAKPVIDRYDAIFRLDSALRPAQLSALVEAADLRYAVYAVPQDVVHLDKAPGRSYS